MGLPDAPKPTTLREIAGAWLVANGYDGLYSDAGGCACSTDDLMPCDEPGTRCKPGYKIPCVCGEGCDFDISATPAPVCETCRGAGVLGESGELDRGAPCPECQPAPKSINTSGANSNAAYRASLAPKEEPDGNA